MELLFLVLLRMREPIAKLLSQVVDLPLVSALHSRQLSISLDAISFALETSLLLALNLLFERTTTHLHDDVTMRNPGKLPFKTTGGERFLPLARRVS